MPQAADRLGRNGQARYCAEMSERENPDRNLAMELVRATESACLAAARWVGRGDKNAADGAAVEAMRLSLSTVAMAGTVVIGEGEKDDAPMLYNGEEVGDGSQPEVDVAVDPIDGTTLTALGKTNALSVIAVADRGSMLDPGPSYYMNKIAVGPDAVGAIDITASPTQNLRWIAKSSGKAIGDLTCVILDRPRHAELIDEVRASGCRIRLITDGDVYGSVATCWPDAGVDVLMGIGGTPEAVVSAAAMKAMDGEIQCQFLPQSDDERTAMLDAGLRPRSHSDAGRPDYERQLLLRRHRAHRRGIAARRALRQSRRPHTEPRHALTQRHGPHDRCAASHEQAARVRGNRLLSEAL